MDRLSLRITHLREGLEVLRRDEERLRYILQYGTIADRERAHWDLARLKEKIKADELELKHLEAQQ